MECVVHIVYLRMTAFRLTSHHAHMGSISASHVFSAPIHCYKCHQTIERKHIVVGVPLKDVRGLFGYITIWSHLECGMPILNLLVGVTEIIKSQSDATTSEAKNGRTASHDSSHAATETRKKPKGKKSANDDNINRKFSNNGLRHDEQQPMLGTKLPSRNVILPSKPCLKSMHSVMTN